MFIVKYKTNKPIVSIYFSFLKSWKLMVGNLWFLLRTGQPGIDLEDVYLIDERSQEKNCILHQFICIFKLKKLCIILFYVWKCLASTLIEYIIIRLWCYSLLCNSVSSIRIRTFFDFKIQRVHSLRLDYIF